MYLQHAVRRALGKLWAPVPWMLEAAILLQLFLGDYVEAGVGTLLLVANAAIGFFQEGRAQATLDALKSGLALVAAVQRDGIWTTVVNGRTVYSNHEHAASSRLLMSPHWPSFEGAFAFADN